MILVAWSSLLGALGAWLLASAIAASVWAASSPNGVRRAIEWGLRNGLLAAVGGVVTGPLAAMLTAARRPRVASRLRAAIEGAMAGAVVGAGLAVLTWSEAAGPPVAVGSFVAETLMGAAIVAIARARP